MSEHFVPYEIIDGDLSSGLILLCDHARNTLPDIYGTLGLPAIEFERHIAYDIGAEALTRGLAERLNVPAVLSCFSRLLVDPNRGEDDPTIVMRLSDGTIVPGNHPIAQDEIARRIECYHSPYHRAVEQMIDRCLATGVNPMIFSVHSFTDRWKDQPRHWQGAILWDADPRLPHFAIDRLRRDPSLTIGDNEPYDGALAGDTLYRHATKRGLAHALLEVRQDLISSSDGIEGWVDRLAPMLEEANQCPDMHEIRHYGSRADGTARSGDE